jgi:hypothetical protein
MSTTDDHKAMLPPYVKSLDAARADALGCWPRDYCHRDDRKNSPDCDCFVCARTMQRRAHDRAQAGWIKRTNKAAAQRLDAAQANYLARRSYLRAMEELP